MTQVMGYIFLALIVGLVLFSAVRPWMAIVLILCFHPAKQALQVFIPAFAFNSALANYIIFSCIPLAIIGAVFQRGRVLAGHFNPAFLAMVSLWVFALLSLMWTPNFDRAEMLVRDGVPYWLSMVLLLPLAVLSLEQIRRMLMPAVLIGCLIIFVIILSPATRFYAGRLITDLGRVVGRDDIHGNPLATATMGAQIAIIAALMMPMRASLFWAVLRWGAVFLGIGIGLMSGSRLNTVFGVLMIAAFYPMARQVRDLKQFVLRAAGLGMFGLVLVLAIRYFTAQDVEQATRWDVSWWWQDAMDRLGPVFMLLGAWVSSPMALPIGLGANAVDHIVPGALYVHNMPAEVLGEYGLIGAAFYLTAMGTTFWLGYRLWRMYRDDPPMRATAAILVAQSAYLFANSLKEYTLLQNPSPFWIWAILAKVAWVELYSRRPETQPWLEHPDYVPDAEVAAAYEAGLDQPPRGASAPA